MSLPPTPLAMPVRFEPLAVALDVLMPRIEMTRPGTIAL